MRMVLNNDRKMRSGTAPAARQFPACRFAVWFAGLVLLAAGDPINSWAANGGPTGLEAYVDPLNGNVPVPRETRVDSDESRKLAFPSARGHGRFADPDIGPGQDFQVFKVTNTSDSGPGSYREAIMSTSGPRVVIFTISGTIDLTEDVLMREAQDDVYIAGQTSPGGVQFKCSGNNKKAPLRAVRTSDIVARFLKLRPGLDHAVSSDMDSLAMGDVRNCIFDHLSLQWSTDEAAHITSKDGGVTLQWSLQSEPLRCGPCRGDNHAQHDYGVFCDVNENLTLYKNLFMGGRWRNPNVQATNSLELINNVGYNYGQYAAQFYVNATRGNLIANIVGNWYSKGPRTVDDPHMLYAAYEGSSTYGFEFYLKGNVGPRDTNGCGNVDNSGPLLTSPILEQFGTLLNPAGEEGVIFLEPRAGGLSIPSAEIVTAEEALKDVIAGAGALQDVFDTPRRDLVDARSIGQLQNATNHAYTPAPDPLDAIPPPGYPDLTQGATWTWAGNDTDDDGMLDSWENLYADLSLTPNGDPDGDGWSNMEEFLNYLAGEHIQWNGTGNPALFPPPGSGYPALPQPDPDTDADGLPDDWERYTLNTLAYTATNDFDNDGLDNQGELTAGTDPDDDTDFFQLDIESVDGSVQVDLPTVDATEYWFGGQRRFYSLQHAAQLPGSWEPIPAKQDIPAGSGDITYSPTGGTGFFGASVSLQ